MSTLLNSVATTAAGGGSRQTKPYIPPRVLRALSGTQKSQMGRGGFQQQPFAFSVCPRKPSGWLTVSLGQ